MPLFQFRQLRRFGDGVFRQLRRFGDERSRKSNRTHNGFADR
ncbi:hypothetical protein LTSEMON_2605 [Salmonella enterica subsp. enterica serovar Montevideo str. S5-403]|uniref:Uncharacterized protein n=1 Tax=Salmonella enterica subsp. enterica serovar Montevideo str. S5-403 TaxID=913242 RepID=G5Q3L8_SALMO|nr:hypothetical protein LTSEMON_2605 [Salmonella enterica subsp. enterica serovar Montevideo str. S5-403]